MAYATSHGGGGVASVSRAGELLTAVESDIVQRTKELRSLLLLRHSGDDAAQRHIAAQLEASAHNVAQLEEQLRAIRTHIAHERCQIDDAQRVTLERARRQAERLQQLEQGMPRHVPSKAPSNPMRAEHSAEKLSATVLTSRSNTVGNTNQLPAMTKNRKQASAPQLAYVTVSELNKTPQYLRGRLTLEKLNDGVDALNAAISAKYELLRRPMRELTSEEINHVQALHELESDETDGYSFISSVDIRSAPQLRPESTLKNILNVLRHCKRIREVRGPRSVRLYLITNSS